MDSASLPPLSQMIVVLISPPLFHFSFVLYPQEVVEESRLGEVRGGGVGMELKGKLTAGEKVGKRRRKESGRRWEEDSEGEGG